MEPLATISPNGIDPRSGQAPRAVDEAGEVYRKLVEHSLVGTFVVLDQRLLYANRRAAQIFGRAPADLAGLPIDRLVIESDRRLFLAEASAVADGRLAVGEAEFRVRLDDGREALIGAHLSRMVHQGRPAAMFVMTDITERRLAEAQASRHLAQLQTAMMDTVRMAMRLVECRDPYTAGHERRVGEIAVAIGRAMGFDDERLTGLRVAGFLHDVGKMTVPIEILSKPGRLTPLEFEMIKGHAQAGCEVLSHVAFPWPVAEVARQHHERMDGSGYPCGRVGDQIAVEARIVAVADVAEAMTSHRPYRPALGLDAALSELRRGRATLYDARAVDACLRLYGDHGMALPD